MGHYCNTEYLHSRSLVENKILSSLFLNLSLIWSNDLYGGLSENMQSILFSRFLIFFSWKKTIRLLPTSVFWISWTCFHATCFIFVLGFGEKHRKKKKKNKENYCTYYSGDHYITQYPLYWVLGNKSFLVSCAL